MQSRSYFQASNPRVTKFKINWENPDNAQSPLDAENIPPMPANQLPPKKDNMLDSPMKTGLMEDESNNSFPHNSNKDKDETDMDMDC